MNNLEHIIVTILPNGYFELTPEEGYILFDKRTKHLHSKAIVSNRSIQNFSAVEI